MLICNNCHQRMGTSVILHKDTSQIYATFSRTILFYPYLTAIMEKPDLLLNKETLIS